MNMPSRSMRIVPRDILNSRQALELVRALSRIVPPSIGHALAYRLADLVASRKDWTRVKAVRCNQWVVRGEKLTKLELDHAVRETFRNIAHSLYDVHHYVDNPKAIDRLIEFSPAIQSIVAQSQSAQNGKVFLSLHLGNFDLALQVLTLRGLRGMVFTLPPTEGGYPLQNKLRRNVGVEAYPVDMNSLRQAIRRLRDGETVITAADWPVPDSKYSPSFFSQPSVAPTHYAYLAQKAGVPVVMVVILRKVDARYHFLVSEPIYMREYPDKHLGLIRNTEMVLKVAEDYIRLAPQQWAMSHPLWPELMDQIP